MAGNLGRLQTETGRVKRLGEYTWQGTLQVWLVFVFVCVAFAGTYVFIRIVPKA